MRENIFYRVLLIFIFTLGTVSCGFTPVYGPDSETAATLSDITVAPPVGNRLSYIFVRELETRIGQNLSGSKILEHSIQLSEETFESAANYVRLTGRVNYSIVSAKDRIFLFGGFVEDFTSFTASNDVLASGRKGAEVRIIAILAERMTTELIGQFSNPKNQ